MSLSILAKQYLSTLKKNEQYSASKTETRNYLVKQGIPPTEALLNFQAEYSGLTLTIANQTGRSFFARLFSRKSILCNKPLDKEIEKNQYIFDCGIHQTAQFGFFLTQNGQVCTSEEEDNINILYGSFEKMIEEYAWISAMVNPTQYPTCYEINDQERLVHFLKKTFEVVLACSDEYFCWWKGEGLIIQNGVWLDQPKRFFRLYYEEKNQSDQLIRRLVQERIIT